MDQHYTEGARRALERSARLAATAGATEVQPYHLLWALVLDESLAADILRQHRIGPDQVAQWHSSGSRSGETATAPKQTADHVEAVPQMPRGTTTPPLSAELARVLEVAQRSARRGRPAAHRALALGTGQRRRRGSRLLAHLRADGHHVARLLVRRRADGWRSVVCRRRTEKAGRTTLGTSRRAAHARCGRQSRPRGFAGD
ncbi:MAG: hypothetical protein GXP27_11150 [Planctomycetes bacterium]|nr:hypothetical protein [Planctomycetota bacterium]